MNYRMYTGGAKAGENLIELIKQDLEKNHGFRLPNFSIDFIAFDAMPGTRFILNTNDNVFKVPPNGKFITPYDGTRYLTIKRFVFEEDFNGDIYYIY